MLRRWSVMVFLCCLYLTPLAQSQDQPGKVAAEKLTVDDVIGTERIEEMHFSPDGKRVLWVKRAADKDKGEMVSHLVLTNLADQQDIVLTRGRDSCTSPRWSPDGKWLAFLSSRPAPKGKSRAEGDDDDEPHAQIWLMHASGGEPYALTKFARDVRACQWRDADTLIFVAQEKLAHREAEAKEKKDTTTFVEDETIEPPVRLFQVTVKDKKVVRLTDNTDRIQALFLSPDRRQAVTIHERSLSYTFDHKIKPAVYLTDLKTGQRRRILDEPRYNILAVHWRPDSSGFYAINAFASNTRFLHAYVAEVHDFDLASGTVTPVDLDWSKGLAFDDEQFSPTGDGFVTLLADGVRHKPARIIRQGKTWKRLWLEGDHARNIYNLTADKDGKTALYLHTKASGTYQWYRANLQEASLQAPKKIFDLEPDVAEKKLARTDVIRWKGARDDEVEGLLFYPVDYQPNKKYPLVVMIHGGPFWADFDAWNERWSYAPNLVCAKGAFVFMPNYHGSSNYGLEWGESIANGKYYDLPVVDIEKGIDHLVAKGLADPERIGLSGWSNGAILTMALITRNPRYKAAAAGAGGSEWVADWGTCEFGMSFDNYYFGKSPLEDPQLYIKNAPFYQFPKIKTPLLLFHGSEDTVVPSHHGWMQFRTLRELGKTDVRFVLFPGEKHGLTKLAHQKRKLEEELAWFDKHLLQTWKGPNLALKADSPLAHALLLQEAKRQGKLYGIMKNGVLVPETVAFQKLTLGRFEVTRAQFAEFDKKYAVEPGTENYPANGITLDQAKAYCTWLSMQTGEKYRLGSVQEMEDLDMDDEGQENTLDYWAGYAVNPEDRARLLEKIRSLPGQAPLLKEVGSFASADPNVGVFDLGGNVAEWAIDKSGGRPVGGSADLPADDIGPRRQPGAAYIGFRVLRSSLSP